MPDRGTVVINTGQTSLTGPLWVVAALNGVCFAGLAYLLIKAARSQARDYSGSYAQTMARQFEDVFLFVPPRLIAKFGWGLAIFLFLLVFLGLSGNFSSAPRVVAALLLGLIVAGPALAAPRQFLAIVKRRRLRRFNLQLVDTLVSMSNALKAGFSITQAFETVVKDGENPIAQEFGLFLQQTRMGVSFSDALANLEQRVGSEDMTLVAMAIETARRTGGNLTEIFDKISRTIRERLRIENRIRTMTAQGRLQGIVVGAMPIVIGVVLMIIDRETMLPFLTSIFGLVSMIAVVFLIAFGAFFIRKIIRIDI
jgi:tight adherence protein B